jgi:hypothetical protein
MNVDGGSCGEKARRGRRRGDGATGREEGGREEEGAGRTASIGDATTRTRLARRGRVRASSGRSSMKLVAGWVCGEGETDGGSREERFRGGNASSRGGGCCAVG